LVTPTVTTRTPDETLYAHFWADVPSHSVTPPGHWDEIAEHLALQEHLNLEENARLFGLLNIGLADAAINCWDAKYIYNYWRPITAIRDPRASQINPVTTSDSNWTPLWNTPNFPSYTSGHSTFSGTASTILASIFGTNVGFTNGSDDMPGYSRSFTSLGQAADEAGESRVVGGIHFFFDNVAGLTAGREIGGYVAGNFLQPLRKRGDREGSSASDLKTARSAMSAMDWLAALSGHARPADFQASAGSAAGSKTSAVADPGDSGAAGDSFKPVTDYRLSSEIRVFRRHDKGGDLWEMATDY
jgi:PAP2 superfamily